MYSRICKNWEHWEKTRYNLLQQPKKKISVELRGGCVVVFFLIILCSSDSFSFFFFLMNGLLGMVMDIRWDTAAAKCIWSYSMRSSKSECTA
jgi:hypothetical protein